MSLREVYTEILTEHNKYPSNQKILELPDCTLQGVNPNCGDDYTVSLKFDGDTIVDGGFTGSGCAIS